MGSKQNPEEATRKATNPDPSKANRKIMPGRTNKPTSGRKIGQASDIHPVPGPTTGTAGKGGGTISGKELRT